MESFYILINSYDIAAVTMQQLVFITAASTVISLGTLLMFVRNHKRLQKLELQTQTLIQAVQHDVQAMGSGAMGVGQRLVEVEKKLNDTVGKQQELERYSDGDQPYSHAAELINMGAGIDEVIGTCGISRSEAELVDLLHRQHKLQPKPTCSYNQK